MKSLKVFHKQIYYSLTQRGSRGPNSSPMGVPLMITPIMSFSIITFLKIKIKQIIFLKQHRLCPSNQFDECFDFQVQQSAKKSPVFIKTSIICRRNTLTNCLLFIKIFNVELIFYLTHLW